MARPQNTRRSGKAFEPRVVQVSSMFNKKLRDADGVVVTGLEAPALAVSQGLAPDGAFRASHLQGPFGRFSSSRLLSIAARSTTRCDSPGSVLEAPQLLHISRPYFQTNSIASAIIFDGNELSAILF